MFGLNSEQEQLRKEVRAFAEREIAPHVSEWDEKSEFPHAVVKKLSEMGLMGVIFPESLGGAGMGYVEYVLAIEELSRIDGSVGIIVAAHNSLCTNHIMLAANDEQRKRWIPKLASGAVAGRVGIDGARVGVGCRRGADDSGEARRQVGAEWVKDVHHEWDVCELRGCAGGDGQGEGHPRGDLGICGGEGDEGISAGEEREQAGAAGERYCGADL